MDEYRPRPGDEHVEPLFAGLRVGEPREPDPRAVRREPGDDDAPATGGRARWIAVVVLALALGGSLAWWLG